MPLEVYEAIHPSCRYNMYDSDLILRAANGNQIACAGMVLVDMLIEGQKLTQLFYVCRDVNFVILGTDCLGDHDITVALGKNKIFLKDNEIPAFDHTGYHCNSRVTLGRSTTIPPRCEAVLVGNVRSKRSQEGKRCIVKRASTALNRTGALVCRVVATPKNGQVPLRVMNCGDQPLRVHKGSVLGLLEPIQSVQTWEEANQSSTYSLESCTCMCTCKKKQDLTSSNSSTTPDVRVHDTSAPVQNSQSDETKVDCPSTLCCHTYDHLSLAERYDKYIEDAEEAPQENANVFEARTDIPEHVKDLYEQSCQRLTKPEHKNRLAKMLITYTDRFAAHADDVGRTTLLKHHVDTGDEAPVRQRCRRFAKCHIEVIQDHVRKLAAAGIIRPSTSEWASNCVVVKKKDGTWRLCIDYREVNLKTKNPDSYLLPRIDDTLDALSQAKYFCTLDLIQGYHQVELTESSKEKTAFHAPYCNPSQWEYVYMPFGLVKAPRTFQRLMDRVIQGLEYKIALAYLDDIIVYGKSIDACLDNMEVVLQRLRDANLKLKAKKCILFAKEVEYLGHVITSDGVHTDPKKIEAVRDWHPPRTVKQVRSFLGMATYYSRFIKNYAEISRPLQNLNKKNTKFKWTEEEQRAFETIKQRLMSAPILAYPNSEGMFILDTDASDYCYGAVLSQMQMNSKGVMEERPIAYASKKFSDTERFYCARRRELLAIINFVKHFNVYLRGPTFLIRTDHASLRYIKTVRDLPAQFYRWIMLLEEYSYKIEIRKGTLHSNADAMSRGCHGKGCICEDLIRYETRQAIRGGTVLDGNLSCAKVQQEVKNLVQTPVANICTTDGRNRKECVVAAFKLQPTYDMQELAMMQEEDPDVGPVLKAKRTDPVTRPPWINYSGESPATKAYYADWKRLELHENVLYRRWESDDGQRTTRQLVVPRKLQGEFCSRVHDSARTCHMGRRRVLHALHHFCFWYKMYDDVSFWVKACIVCQRRKKPNPPHKAPMKLYPTGAPGERISMDILGPLVLTPRGNLFVLVIADHFSKVTKAFPLKDQKAETIARVLTERWILEYGEPMQVHADQGTNFESALIKELCKIHGIEKTRTSPYHPQADGMVEKFNKTLVDLLKSICEDPTEWDEKLPIACAAYNSTVHDTSGYTPNMLMFGHELRHSQSKIVPEPCVQKETGTYSDYVRKLKQRYEVVFDTARKTLRKRALLQKKYYDRKANLIQYKEGERIWLSSHTACMKGTSKFAPKYDGPFWVIDCLSDVNFRVQRSEEKPPKIVHHDRMKPYVSTDGAQIPDWVRKASRKLSGEMLSKQPVSVADPTPPKSEDGSVQQETAPTAVDATSTRKPGKVVERKRTQSTSGVREPDRTTPKAPEVETHRLPVPSERKKRGRPPKRVQKEKLYDRTAERTTSSSPSQVLDDHVSRSASPRTRTRAASYDSYLPYATDRVTSPSPGGPVCLSPNTNRRGCLPEQNQPPPQPSLRTRSGRHVRPPQRFE